MHDKTHIEVRIPSTETAYKAVMARSKQLERESHRWLTDCVVPDGVERRFYYGVHVDNASRCLIAGFENNAASWMWRDWAELDEGFAPVAGTLQVARRHGMRGILYIDARDVAREIQFTNGGGI